MTKPTRRSVLRAGVIGTAAAVPLGAATQAFGVFAGGMASGLRRSTFQPHVGSTFALDDGSYTAVLTKVGDLKAVRRGHDKKFRLHFAVTGKPPEGSYKFSHPKTGPVNLFVSPIGGGNVYEAIVDAR